MVVSSPSSAWAHESSSAAYPALSSLLMSPMLSRKACSALASESFAVHARSHRVIDSNISTIRRQFGDSTFNWYLALTMDELFRVGSSVVAAGLLRITFGAIAAVSFATAAPINPSARPIETQRCKSGGGVACPILPSGHRRASPLQGTLGTTPEPAG
jgi:hypothetical protein